MSQQVEEIAKDESGRESNDSPEVMYRSNTTCQEEQPCTEVPATPIQSPSIKTPPPSNTPITYKEWVINLKDGQQPKSGTPDKFLKP